MDETRLAELSAQSQDLQADALRDMRSMVRDLREVGRSRKGRPVDLDAVRSFNAERRRLLRNGGIGLGGLAARGLFAGGFGSALAAVVASPAHAQADLDVQVLQTAASLENLAVATYEAALTLPFVKDGNKTVVAFAKTTMQQHAEHGMAFNEQVEALGGQRQDEPHPMFAQVVEQAKPSLKGPLDVVNLAAQLEEVATDTYLTNLGLLGEMRSRELMVQVMGVEAQHLAILRAVKALLEGGAEELVAVPTDLAALPAAAGSVAFEGALEQAPEELVAAPESGAVK